MLYEINKRIKKENKKGAYIDLFRMAYVKNADPSELNEIYESSIIKIGRRYVTCRDVYFSKE